ncbi:Spo0E family sporulation regulatory protein-aspartic acid phosphatase [Desulfofundulus salinus]|uniref:Spo0E family sporulation regulatory protein-aspartic acid phosphatase n=1 Tax=Desulfofundulus salinus TaxID=2419843 RepID=A0A494WY03_9FIRM|nr:Spo0E family sporulation regulatory protein-aspartic acid phosphatase [Desulfofundulus salinum]RKO65757.1 Spo0E family sporulation regulatory protein-aspartic acid phosphatase [Desulfofundulus salinum]
MNNKFCLLLRIERLRRRLNETGWKEQDRLLTLSRRLDTLIVQYQRLLLKIQKPPPGERRWHERS